MNIKNIKEKLMKIFSLEFWLLQIPFLFSALVFSLAAGLFLAKYLFEYLFPNDHEYFLTYFLISCVASFYLVIRISKTKENNKEKSLVNFFRTRSKKLIFLLFFVIWQYFNFTGFCYREMKYLSDKELLDKVIIKEFVMKDEAERHKALNKKCSIREGILTQSELDEKFSTRKCGDIDYRSWAEFFQKKLDRKCYEDLDNSTKDCGVFYYSSLEEFYGENPNCCAVRELHIRKVDGWEWEIGSIGFWEYVSSRLVGLGYKGAWIGRLVGGNYWHGDLYFVNYCGDSTLEFKSGNGIKGEDNQDYLKQKAKINKTNQ